LKRQMVITATIVGFVLCALPAPARPASSQVEGPIINNLAADVFLYWDKVKILSLDEKYKTWMETVENKHAAFFQKKIYGGVGRLSEEMGKRKMVEWDLDTLNQKMTDGLIGLKKEATI
jgi:hypothetical protein